MTTEHIKHFYDFLSCHSMYYTFCECLSKAPITECFAKKDVYLMRVNTLLVLNYCFYQDRGINKVREADWRHLREAWIAAAAASNILGEEFTGIEPKHIISAMNAEFNGKQFTGTIADADKYTARIALRAQALQDEQDARRSQEEEDEEVKELRKIIDDNTVRETKYVYTADKLADLIRVQTLTDLDLKGYSGKKNISAKKGNAFVSAIGSRSLPVIKQCITDMRQLLDEITGILNAAEQTAKEKFETDRAEYERQYQLWLQKQADASKRLYEIQLAQSAALRAEPKSTALPSVPVPRGATEGTVTTPAHPAERVIMLHEKNAPRRVSLMPNQCSCTYDDTPGTLVYRITINSTISRRITESDLYNYQLVERSGRICLRFTSEQGLSHRVNRSNRGNSCNITDKLLVAYLRRHFQISSRTMILNVAIDETEPKPNLLIELQSAKIVTFE